MQVKKPSLRKTKSFVQRCCQPTQVNPNVTDTASVYQGTDMQGDSKTFSYFLHSCTSVQIPRAISPGSVSPWDDCHREREVFSFIPNQPD